MTQRKIPKTVAAKNSGHRATPARNQYLTRFEASILYSSTPGPVTNRSDDDPRQALDQMHELRNRLHSWSYKGTGIKG